MVVQYFFNKFFGRIGFSVQCLHGGVIFTIYFFSFYHSFLTTCEIFTTHLFTKRNAKESTCEIFVFAPGTRGA